MPSSAPVRSTLRPRRACTAAWSCGRTCRGPGRLRTSDPRRGRPADRLGGAGPGGRPRHACAAPASRTGRRPDGTPERLGTGALSPRETERRRKTWGSGHAAGGGDRLRPSARRPVGDPRQSRQRAHVLPGRGDPGSCRHSVDGSALTLRGPLGADPRRTGPRVLSSGCGSIVRPGLAPGTGWSEETSSPGGRLSLRHAGGARTVPAPCVMTPRSAHCAPGAGVAALAPGTRAEEAPPWERPRAHRCAAEPLTNTRLRGGPREVRCHP